MCADFHISLGVSIATLNTQVLLHTKVLGAKRTSCTITVADLVFCSSTWAGPGDHDRARRAGTRVTGKLTLMPGETILET